MNPREPPRIEFLENRIQPYAWGSRTAIPQLLGQPTPSNEPQAELWMGAHPMGPSRIASSGEPLSDRIARDPRTTLGTFALERFGPRLPFLLKILAAETPLSLQAHPTLGQAQAGYDREEALGVPLSSPTRNYKDRFHKPELICALTRFEALCGFRAPEATIALLEWMSVEELTPFLTVLRRSPDASGLRQVFTTLTTLPANEKERLVRAVVTAGQERDSTRTLDANALALIAKLSSLYPDDIGVVSALLLNHVRLEPGEAIYLPAGNLHAYLQGVGVEIMASSDNVLRGGLTPKHVDVPELLHILDFQSGPVPILQAREVEGEAIYETPAQEFRLSRFHLAQAAKQVETGGPEILFCSQGSIQIAWENQQLSMSRGSSAFVPAQVRAYRISGEGELFRARVGGGHA